MEHPIERLLESCVSTNDEAKRLAELGAPHGSWVSAKQQLTGRGRIGREWESLEGNLFLSVVARIEDDRHVTWIPLVTALTIAEILRELFSTQDQPFTVKVKWPNDLEVEGKKLGGILCEGHLAAANMTHRYVVVGIGLNLLHHPELPNRPATSVRKVVENLKIDSPSSTWVEQVRRRLVAELPLVWSLLEREGAYAFLPTYDRYTALRPGDQIEFSESGQTHSAKVQGLGELGELLVEQAIEGQVAPVRRSLFAEEVRAIRGRG